MAVRLYVGGIPVGITPHELEDRFLPFGSVVHCEIVPPKTHSILLHGAERQTVSYPRNFGYVSLLPKDERSLQRAISCYNGTRWRGSVMRCQIAKPTMMDTIAAEKAQMSEDEVTGSQVHGCFVLRDALNIAWTADRLHLSVFAFNTTT